MMRPVLGPAVGILASILLTLLPSGQEPASTSRKAGARAGKAALDGIQLAYETRGAGEPVVLVHAGGFAEWFKPLLEQRLLTDRYRVISYHRIGYGDSSRVSGTVTLIDQAAQLRALLRHLGIARAHVVGHSSGGDTAGSSSVSVSTISGASSASCSAMLFTRDEARRISQPVLAITGEKSAAVSPVWPQRQALLLEWLPNAEGFVLPGATHLLHVQNPRGTADQLVTFLGRHRFSKKQ